MMEDGNKQKEEPKKAIADEKKKEEPKKAIAFATIENVCGLLELKGDEATTNKIKERLKASYNTAEKALEKVDPGPYHILKRSLPGIAGLDFSKPDDAKEKIGSKVKQLLETRMAGIKNESKKDIETAYTKAYTDFYYAGIPFDEDFGKNIDEHLKSAKTFESIKPMPIPDFSANVMTKREFEEYIKEHKEYLVPIKDFYCGIDEKNNKFFILTEDQLNEENIKTIIAEKATDVGIKWKNVSKKKQELVATLCLRAGKKVFFDDKEDELSETMPETPRDWKGWIEKIQEKGQIEKKRLIFPPKSNSSTFLTEKLLTKVVDDDEKLFKEFWSDIQPLDKKIINNIKSHFTSEQKKWSVEQEPSKLLHKAEEALASGNLGKINTALKEILGLMKHLEGYKPFEEQLRKLTGIKKRLEEALEAEKALLANKPK